MRYLIIVAALALAGCEKAPVATSSTDNPEVGVAKMFTHEGCTIYRFYDNGHAHYWADCRGSVETNWSTACGKGCARHESDLISQR